ncbi:hypothetical protein [Defluviimonas sp. WL0075]|uniref:Roadblock/LAMTOR2 domain-containing protein n=1 Tax=Albidovulum sediminicola TaxID=2984331 RepID=A0ABT2Z575_9RHOB|nr:hypothetical protein [Defluviimonas sp. WL0075]MCV2866268.1 hypothetical protein [Defluviimonas sp. WL0075]
MALNELMDGTLRALPECLAVCYVDMPEELVLTRRSSRAFSQEVLDAVATLASRLLEGRGVAEAWRQAAVAPEEERPGEAILANDDFTCLFLRMEKHDEHALCLIANRGADVAQMRLAGRALGKDIANIL